MDPAVSRPDLWAERTSNTGFALALHPRDSEIRPIFRPSIHRIPESRRAGPVVYGHHGSRLDLTGGARGCASAGFVPGVPGAGVPGLVPPNQKLVLRSSPLARDRHDGTFDPPADNVGVQCWRGPEQGLGVGQFGPGHGRGIWVA